MISQNAIYVVLNCVRLEGGFADAEDLVILAQAIRPKDFAASEYEQAVTACIAQGWIKVLTQEDCLADAARWEGEPHQDLETYREGSIDYTPSGWEFSVRLHSARYGGGVEGLFSGGIDYLWDTPGQLTVYPNSLDPPTMEA